MSKAAPIIASPPGYQVLAARMVAGKAEIRLTPVIAWQCGIATHDESALDDPFFLLSFPVIPNCCNRKDESEFAHMIVYPSGVVSDGGTREWPDIEAFKKFFVDNWINAQLAERKKRKRAAP